MRRIIDYYRISPRRPRRRGTRIAVLGALLALAGGLSEIPGTACDNLWQNALIITGVALFALGLLALGTPSDPQ